MPRFHPSPPPNRAAGRIALLYLVLAGAWILLSDWALGLWVEDAGEMQLLQSIKGAVFVLATSLALFLLVRHQLYAAERDGERSRLLEAAVEETGEAVMVTDARGRIEYVNPAFERTTGHELDEIRGQTPSFLRSGRQPEGFYRRMWNTLREGRIFEGEFVNRRKDGSLYWKEATITPVHDARGRTSHYIDISRDVTEQRRLRRQLREAQKAELLGHISGGIVHDSRNVLGVIQAHTDLALQSCDRGRFPREELEEIGDAVRHGSELLKAFLSLGRKGELEFEAQPLAHLVGDMRSTLRAVFPSTVAVETHGDESLVAHVDPGSVHQMVLNLATNARDAMTEGGRFRLTVTEVEPSSPSSEEDAPSDPGAFHRTGSTQRWVALEATDDGAGMDEDTRQRVLEPLFTTKPSDRGTGLGMSMVARLMEDHGGRVEIESAPGEGTTVRLLFPATVRDEAAVGSKDASDESSAPLPRGTETILVAEDEAPLRDALCRSLERLGYRPLPAENGLEALDRLGRERVDLVITDLVMPRMGGRELSDEMRVLGWTELPLIFVSGYQAQDTEAGEAAPEDRYFLEKPWTLVELARKVRNALDMRAERLA